MKNGPTTHFQRRATFSSDCRGRTKGGQCRKALSALFKKSFELIKFPRRTKRFSLRVPMPRRQRRSVQQSFNNFPLRQARFSLSYFVARVSRYLSREISPLIFIDFICLTQYARLTDIRYRRWAGAGGGARGNVKKVIKFAYFHVLELRFHSAKCEIRGIITVEDKRKKGSGWSR